MASHSLARRIGSWIPAPLRARLSARLRARILALLGIEPWPDLAVRHPLFREPRYRALRREARAFDVERAHKPVLERGHQTSYLVATWFEAAGVRTAFHIGYASGRHLFYLSRFGIAGGGTDLPADETGWVNPPDGVLDAATRGRMLRVDFLRLAPSDVGTAWAALPLDVFFSEATLETMLPWREGAASVAKYDRISAEERYDLLYERLPAKLGELERCFKNLVLIEPEPSAGGAGRVFEGCADRLASHTYSVWRFRAPFDQLFRLSPSSPVRQVVYVYARDARLTEALRRWADPA
jgi:hypothetical protein